MPRKKPIKPKVSISEKLIETLEVNPVIGVTMETPGNPSVEITAWTADGVEKTFAQFKEDMRKRMWLENKVIHTYFEPTELNYEEELRLLLAWIRRWEAVGYTTRVLNESHARANPRFEAFSTRVQAIHSVNPKSYELSCWYRHCAMEQVGGGAMSDHDVMPSRFEPIPVSDQLTVFEKGVPSLISGTAKAFGAFCDYIQKSKDPEGEKVHRSDMTEIRSFPGLVVDSRCVQYTDTDWKSANWTHFSHASTEKLRPRWKHIDELMREKEAKA